MNAVGIDVSKGKSMDLLSCAHSVRLLNLHLKSRIPPVT